jgi:hypothetical protein
LALYGPASGYSLNRVVTAIIFSASLGTQIFNDLVDHLRFGNLELTAPTPRWRILTAATLPRLALYWLGGIVLLVGIAISAPGASIGELALLIFWYPLVLVPLLALRGVLVFLYPAAGIPDRRDPVQALLVVLLNGMVTLAVILLSLLPFVALLALSSLFHVGSSWFWPVMFITNGALSLASWGLLVLSYRFYEPGETV